MTDIKWIKLFTNVFDNHKIVQIENMPDGDAILVVWLKILTLAGEINENGFVYFTKDIPYTDQMLATQFHKPLATVQLALNTFINFHMIDVVDDVFCVSNWEKYKGIDENESKKLVDKYKEQNRNRVAKYREAKRLEDGQNDANNACNVTVTDCNVTCNVTPENDEKNTISLYNNINNISKNNKDNDINNDKEKEIHKEKEIDDGELEALNRFLDSAEKPKRGKKAKKPRPQKDYVQFAEFVFMEQKEYDTLVEKYGEAFIKRCVEELDNYKGSSGKEYASDYRAILTWVVSKVSKDNPRLMRNQSVSKEIKARQAQNDELDSVFTSTSNLGGGV